jgi:hypothetical protein
MTVSGFQFSVDVYSRSQVELGNAVASQAMLGAMALRHQFP